MGEARDKLTDDNVLRAAQGITYGEVEERGPLSGVGDLLRSTAYNFAQKPADGIVQIINHTADTSIQAPQIVDKPKVHNGWTTAGEIGGAILDFYVISKCLGGFRTSALTPLARTVPVARMFPRLAPGLANPVPILEGGTAGALYELSMPVQDESNFGSTKLKNAAIGFGTFGTMDGVMWGLKGISAVKNSKAFITDVWTNTASGASGGVMHWGLDTGLNDKPLNFYSLGNDVLTYGAFGAGFGALDGGVKRGSAALGNYFQARIDAGKPFVSIGPIEIQPKGHGERLQNLARVDELTGLKNKTGGSEALKAEVSRAQRDQEPLSLNYLDLDNFKKVNDTPGMKHQRGDEVLQEVAAYMKQHYSRGSDIHVREGGDEFMVIMPNTPLEHAQWLAKQFEERMRFAANVEPTTANALINNYPKDLAKLEMLPRQVTTFYKNVDELAVSLMEQRTAITGETINPQMVKNEIARLKERNPGLKENEVIEGKTLEIYNAQDLRNMAEQAAFRFVPQLGQFLKQKGIVTEAQIQEALRIQQSATGERPLLGQILVKQGSTTEAQVQQVFKEQAEMRDMMRMMREQGWSFSPTATPSTVVPNPVSPGAKVFNGPSSNLSTTGSGEASAWGFTVSASFHGQPQLHIGPQKYTASGVMFLRQGIPNEVPRPQLEVKPIRRLQVYEPPAPGEVVVGVSTGAVEFIPGESANAFKSRGDGLMFEKKELRKKQGLRQDRDEGSAPEQLPVFDERNF